MADEILTQDPQDIPITPGQWDALEDVLNSFDAATSCHNPRIRLDIEQAMMLVRCVQARLSEILAGIREGIELRSRPTRPPSGASG